MKKQGFSRNLKILLIDLEMTQGELAARVGMSRPYLNLIVNGRLLPTDHQQEKIAQALGCRTEDIFEEGVKC